VKVLQKRDPEALVRLKREVRSLHDVRHPNLVSLYELVAEGDAWFFTLEFIEGVDFLSWVRPALAPRADPYAPTAQLGRTVQSAASAALVDRPRVEDAFR
jgi:serine/threonine protein kinase